MVKNILRRSVGSMVEAETGFVPTSAQIIAVSNLLFTEISTLNSFLCPKVQCITVFRSGSCSQPIRQRICRRTVTLYFNLHWNSQIHVKGSQLDHFSPLRRTPPLLRRSGLSNSEAWTKISQCGHQSEPPVPSYSSSRLGRQQSRCSRRRGFGRV